MEENKELENQELDNQKGGEEKKEDEMRKKFPQLQTIGIEEIIDVVTFPVQLPNPQLIYVLKYLSNQKDKKIVKKDLINYIADNPELFPNYIKDSKKPKKVKTPPADLSRAKEYAWVNQNIVNKLKNEWGMVEIEMIGKYSYIKLTQRGEDILDYLI